MDFQSVNFPFVCINISLEVLRQIHKFQLESYSIKHNDMFANWRREWSEEKFRQKATAAFANSISAQQIGCINKSFESTEKHQRGTKNEDIHASIWNVRNLKLNSKLILSSFPIPAPVTRKFFIYVALEGNTTIYLRKNVMQIIFQFKLHKIFTQDRIETGLGKGWKANTAMFSRWINRNWLLMIGNGNWNVKLLITQASLR